MTFDFVPVDEQGRMRFDQQINNLSADQANALLLGKSPLPAFLRALLRKAIEDGEIVVNIKDHKIVINNCDTEDNEDNNDTPKVLIIAPNRLG